MIQEFMKIHEHSYRQKSQGDTGDSHSQSVTILEPVVDVLFIPMWADYSYFIIHK